MFDHEEAERVMEHLSSLSVSNRSLSLTDPAQMMHSPSIPKSPDPKEQPAAARDSSTRVNAPQIQRWPQWPRAPWLVPARPALGASSRDSPAASVLPKAAECQQVRGGDAPRSALLARSRRPAREPRAGGGGPESARTRAHAAFRPAKVAEPARRLARCSRAPRPGAGTPTRRAREQRPQQGRALKERAEGAGDSERPAPGVAYPARRRRSVLPLPAGPPRPPAAEGGALPLSLPAARNHGDDQIHMESKFIKIHVQPPVTYLYS